MLAQHALQLTRLPTRLQQEGELSHTVADGDGEHDGERERDDVTVKKDGDGDGDGDRLRLADRDALVGGVADNPCVGDGDNDGGGGHATGPTVMTRTR